VTCVNLGSHLCESGFTCQSGYDERGCCWSPTGNAGRPAQRRGLRRRASATQPTANSSASATSAPCGDIVGAGAAWFGAQTPAWPGTLHDCPAGHEAVAQQTSSTQLPERQSVGSRHEPPFGFGVRVGVTVGVLVGVWDGVKVGVAVGVLVGVAVGVWVGVNVGVADGVLVGVLVGVSVGVKLGVAVGTVLLM